MSADIEREWSLFNEFERRHFDARYPATTTKNISGGAADYDSVAEKFARARDWKVWQARAAIPQVPTEKATQRRAPSEADSWLGLAHITYDEAGIPAGEIIARLVELSGKGQACIPPSRAEPASPIAANAVSEFEIQMADILHAAVVKALLDHRMVNVHEMEDDGPGANYPLVDYLCLEGGRDIATGEQEIEAIAHAAVDEILPLIAPAFWQIQASRCRAEGNGTKEEKAAFNTTIDRIFTPPKD